MWVSLRVDFFSQKSHFLWLWRLLVTFQCLQKCLLGVPAVAQRVRNPNVAAQVASGLWVPPPAQLSGLKKGLVSPRLWHGWQL